MRVDLRHGWCKSFTCIATLLLLKEENLTADNIMRNNGFNGALIILNHNKDGYFEGITFASHRTDDLMRFCFSHWDILIQFKQYFLSQYKLLIEDAARCKIKIPRSKDKIVTTKNDTSVDCKKLLQTLQPKYYTIDHNDLPVKVTTKEFACLRHCRQGRKDKETAKLTGLSPKTVEHYLNDLKVKFQVQSRSQLIDIYLVSELVVL